MSDRLRALREKRGKIVAAMKAIMENENPTAEDLDKHGKLFDEQESVRKAIDAETRQIELDREMAAAAQPGVDRAAAGDGGEGGNAPVVAHRATPEYRTAFRNYLAVDVMGGSSLRALTAGVDTQGGYVITPEQFVNELIKAVEDQTFMRGLATVYSVPSADSLGAPSLDADPEDGDWTTELSTGGEDDEMAFGKRELHPHPVAKRIKVSKTLLRKATLGIEALVSDRLAYKFAVTEEKAFLLGDGNNKPLGVFVASNDGIPTSRDVATDNANDAITGDGLINAKFSLKAQYWNNARWLFHRDAMKQISKLKDQNDQYLWLPSLRDGSPDTILGRPSLMSEFAPNTFTTGLYVGMLGDFSQYWIADALDMQIQRLMELYAETNQQGFIARKETDGMPVLAEAFVRVQLG